MRFLFVTLKRPTAVDNMRNAGGECAFIAGEIKREQGDFLRGAEPAHRLARNEHFEPTGASGGGAIEHRWRLDGAGAYAVTTYALGDEIGGDRAGQRGDRGLGRAIDIAVGCGLEHA